MLPWMFVDDNGIVNCADASMFGVYSFRGPDLDSATPEELVAFNANVNNVIRRLPKGYVLYFEAQRVPGKHYDHSEMPTAILQAMEDKRAEFFESGAFYESQYYFVVYHEPPQNYKEMFKNLFIEDAKNKAEQIESDAGLDIYYKMKEDFRKNLNQVGLMLSVVFKDLKALIDPSEVVTYLHSTVSDTIQKVNYNPSRLINTYVSDAALAGGIRDAKLGKQYMKVLTILDFPPMSYPGIFDDFNQLNIRYRWSSRFICIDTLTAKNLMQQTSKNWAAASISLFTRVQQAFTKQHSENDVDQTAILNSEDSKDALAELGSGTLSMGYYTMTMCIFGNTPKEAEENMTLAYQIIQSKGFTAYEETINIKEAWRGTLPGLPRCNVRQPMVNSLNFCHFAPTTSQWSGDKWNEHLKGPVLLNTDSYNSEFRLSFHIGAQAHGLVVGPSGSGKSVLLNTIETYFMKYPKSRVFIFDKAASSRIPTYAAGGHFYNISVDQSLSDLSFQPLSDIDTADERNWATNWIAGYLERAGLEITESKEKPLIREAMDSLAEFPQDKRTISTFCTLLQNTEMRLALKALTSEGPYGSLFDSSNGINTVGRWQVYEMEDVMRIPDIVPIVIDYLFHQIDKTLKNDEPNPTLIVMDECWLFFDNEIFRDKIREYFKDLRKKNASIIIATQNLSDIAQKPDLLATVMENCPNRIFLRNQNATSEEISKFYKMFGMNRRQINIIANLDNQDRHEYYYTCTEKGNRVFDLALNPIEAAFVLSTGKSDQKKLNEIIAAGKIDNFPIEWLTYKQAQVAVTDKYGIPLQDKKGEIITQPAAEWFAANYLNLPN